MTLVINQPFSTSFAANANLQSNGSQVTGAGSPTGMTGRIDIVDGVGPSPGSKAYRARVVDTDADTFGGQRAECTFTAQALNDESWYVFDLLINEADWTGTAQGNFSVFQVHNKDSITAAVNFLLYVRFGAFKIWTPASDPPTEQANYTVDHYPNFTYGQWHQICLHVLWKNDGTGFTDLFINQAPVMRRFNRGNAYNADTPYVKLGIYNVADVAGFGTLSAHYRNFKMFSGKESYTTVMGSTPKPRLLRAAA